MTDSRQEDVPLSHALGNGTVGQPPRTRPSLKALAARVLEGAREPVPLSHALGTGTVGQAVAGSTWDDEDWRRLAPIVEWFLIAEPPAEPFLLKQGIRITDPARWWRNTIIDIRQGPEGPRARYGALQDDLWRVWRMFLPHADPTVEQ